jgi:aryl-alcohol dehydrogenase-like predicted oxidoreductase
MKMRTLGRTGSQVGPYCLGTMMFRQAGNPGRHAPRAEPQAGRRARRSMMIR